MSAPFLKEIFMKILLSYFFFRFFIIHFRFKFFKIGAISKIKPAILMWRFITYYGAILISAPFSYFTKGKRRDDEIKQIEEELESEMDNKKPEEKVTQ